MQVWVRGGKYGAYGGYSTVRQLSRVTGCHWMSIRKMHLISQAVICLSAADSDRMTDQGATVQGGWSQTESWQ